MDKFNIITGNAKEVEYQLNQLRIDKNVAIKGFSSTNETTTVLVEVSNRDCENYTFIPK